MIRYTLSRRQSETTNIFQAAVIFKNFINTTLQHRAKSSSNYKFKKGKGLLKFKLLSKYSVSSMSKLYLENFAVQGFQRLC